MRSLPVVLTKVVNRYLELESGNDDQLSEALVSKRGPKWSVYIRSEDFCSFSVNFKISVFLNMPFPIVLPFSDVQRIVRQAWHLEKVISLPF